MLYDNSQLARVYFQAWQVTGSRFFRTIRDGYRPFQVVALGAPDGGNAADPVGRIAAVPLLQDRGLVDWKAGAYVSRDFTCQAPVTDLEAVLAALQQT
jgi:hypothetical protein